MPGGVVTCGDVAVGDQGNDLDQVTSRFGAR
ncbi:hypothetical protein Pla22_29040 [Rubripirellula amarantea]|uniref:Uncharacterized protein n=1 Tax=Rubripirellula amarantea TaxID=2527999 RepID=A0A5C5WH88_9BACT|nr:hypothetical protein Pla22_29040 [Rubripirellula amarantea]